MVLLVVLQRLGLLLCYNYYYYYYYFFQICVFRLFTCDTVMLHFLASSSLASSLG